MTADPAELTRSDSVRLPVAVLSGNGGGGIPDDDPDEGHAVCAIELGDRLYVAGLRWRSHLAGDGIRAAASDAARRAGARRMALRVKARQYGVPAGPLPPAAAKSASWSLAAVLADSIHGTWLGAWRLTDGRCIVVVVGPSGILPDGDLVFANGDAAREHVQTVAGTSNWKHIYAPADWNIGDAKTVPLDRLLQQARSLASGGRLQSVSETGHTWVKRGVAAAACVAAAAVLSWALKPAAPRRPAADTTSSKEAAPPPLRWVTAANGFGACAAAYRSNARLQMIPGWPITRFHCESGAATTELRMEAPVWVLRGIAPDADIDVKAGTATIRRPYPLPVPHNWPAGTRLGSRSEYGIQLRTAADRVGGTATLDGPAAALPGALPGASQPRPAVQPLANGAAPGAKPLPPPLPSWTVTASAAPAYLLAVLQPLSAAELTSAVLDPGSGIWTLRGIVHVE